jgi:hypothetical protein
MIDSPSKHTHVINPLRSLSGKTPKRTLKGGIVAEDIRIGSGPVAKSGTRLGVYYQGRLKQNNKQFDAQTSGKPFQFRMGVGEVIKAWDIGLEGMKVKTIVLFISSFFVFTNCCNYYRSIFANHALIMTPIGEHSLLLRRMEGRT